MGLYRSRIEFLVMFEVVQHYIMKTSHKSDELNKFKKRGGVHKSGTYGQYLVHVIYIATFSNISTISWRPVLVVEEAGVPGENHQPWASNW
jgi:hypothetical protein